jgi:hypothetical protein
MATRELTPPFTIYVWDGARAATLWALGPDDPRVWGALSRAARRYLDIALKLERADVVARPPISRFAARLAAGATRGFDAIARAATSGAPIPATELSFARETLAIALSESPRADGLKPFSPPAANSVAEAWLQENSATATPARGRAPFPSAEELRDELARAEGPQRRARNSKEALEVRSRLGLEL